MKVEHSVEIDGIRATLVFEVLPEGLELLREDPKDLLADLDTELSSCGEGFRKIRVSEQAQSALLQMHGELYQSLVDSSLSLLTKDL